MLISSTPPRHITRSLCLLGGYNRLNFSSCKALGGARWRYSLVGVAATMKTAVGRRDLRDAVGVGGIDIGTDVLGGVEDRSDVLEELLSGALCGWQL